MGTTLQLYMDAGEAIASARSTSRWFETGKLLLHRAVTGYGPEHYITYQLYNKPVSFAAWRQYLDKRDFCKLLFRYNKKENFSVLEDKVDFAAACLQHGLPHPRIEFTCNYNNPQSPFADFSAADMAVAFDALTNGAYIVKTCNGSDGINLWSIVRVDDGVLVHNINKTVTPTEFAAMLSETGERYLVQNKITVSESLRPIMPGLACGSMRVYTFCRAADGKVTLPYVMAKLPVVGSLSDNLANGSRGNFSAVIDMDRLSITQVQERAKDGLYHEVLTHPDTGVDLRNYPVPDVQLALDLGRRCALAFPDIAAVGWDIVVTSEGAVVLEGNPMFDPHGLQHCAGHGVRDYVPALLNRN